MATLCLGGNGPDNLVLVIMVRGSGEAPRKGQLATRYFPALASALAARGYQVTGADLDYPAMPIGALTDGRIGQYISSAYDNGPSIARQIQTLIGHCPRRKVVAAAYSQGGIALRRAITTQLRSYPNV